MTAPLDDDFPTPADASFSVSATLDGILSRIQAGDRGTHDPALRRRLDLAFSKHHVKLRAFVARELRGMSDQQVEDVVQETFLVAWNKLAEHDGRNFRAWLYSIAANLAANVRRKRREVLSDDGALFDPDSDAESVYGKLRREEREQVLLEASSRALDPGDQNVVYMRYELELPADEIARLAGLGSADEVRVVLQRCKRRLSKEIEVVLRELGHGRSLLRTDG